MKRTGSYSNEVPPSRYRRVGAPPRAARPIAFARISRPVARPVTLTRAQASTLMPETKYFDTAFDAGVTFAGTTWADSEIPCVAYVNSSGVSAAYTDSALIPSAIGSGYGQVNGNRYKLKKIRVRGEVRVAVASDQADAGANTFVRLLLVMDSQPNGVQAQGEEILQDVDGTNENLYSYRRVANSSGRFRILKDEFINLDATNSQTDGTNTGSVAWNAKQFNFLYQPRMPITVNVKSGNATPTVAGLETCNIFMLVAGHRNGSALAVSVIGASRAYYTD